MEPETNNPAQANWTLLEGPHDSHERNEVAEQLGMEARIVKAIKLPPGGSLTQELRGKVRALVNEHAKANGVTNGEIALAIGCVLSTVGEVLGGKYRADDSDFLRKLNKWVEDDECRRLAGKPIGFYSTSVFQTEVVLAKYAKSNARTGLSPRVVASEQARQSIALGYGPGGCGKSAGALALHADDPTSILVRVQEGAGSSRYLSHLILVELGEKPRNSTFGNLEAIKRRLTGSGRLLIVDECHRVKHSGCELIRDLADVCGIPILLLGTTEVSEKLTNVRVGVGNLLYDQFASRVGMQLDLLRGIDGRGGVTRPFFSLDEIRAIFHSNEVRLAQDAAEYLQAMACVIGLGMLRTTHGVWQKAYRAAVRNGRNIVTLDSVRDAARLSLLAAGVDLPAMLGRIDAQWNTHRAMRPPTRRIASGA
jgi:DNA transposition AAA+ family ATPase